METKNWKIALIYFFISVSITGLLYFLYIASPKLGGAVEYSYFGIFYLISLIFAGPFIAAKTINRLFNIDKVSKIANIFIVYFLIAGIIGEISRYIICITDVHCHWFQRNWTTMIIQILVGSLVSYLMARLFIKANTSENTKY